MAYKRNAPTRKWHFKAPLLVLLVVFLVAGAIAALELTDTTHFFHAKKPSYNSPTASPATKGIPDDETSSNTSSNNASGSDSQSGDTKHPTSDTVSGEPLIEPNGNFVNTHSTHGNEQMESICNTTPGATCQISFTNGSTTKSLPPQTTDRGGATYWAWKIKDNGIDLTPGTWTITVTVSQGSEKKSITDATNLEVSL